MNNGKRSHNERAVRQTQAIHGPHGPSRRFRLGSTSSKRARGVDRNEQNPYSPPEDWYEPRESVGDGYQIVVQPPGAGYSHVVTPAQIRARLSELPKSMVEPLEFVQLSRMTRKKQSFPCYGMQWGATLYLYPMEDGLVEYFGTPPKPAQIQEAKMYGGRWRHTTSEDWRLIWTPKAIRDYYLNNILIHELGHLLDNRNRSYTDRERYAEWFAIEHGYLRSRRGEKSAEQRKEPRRVSRRHHRR